MNDKESRRRYALLATVFFWSTATVLKLREEMSAVHGLAVSADLIRADLDWLQEMGLLRWNGEAAQVTERGRDVATLRAKFPGEG